MTNPKTIEAYKKAGVPWTSLNETGHDVALQAKKDQIKNDKNPPLVTSTGFTRSAVDFKTWSTEDFDKLLAKDLSKEMIEKLQAKQLGQQYH